MDRTRSHLNVIASATLLPAAAVVIVSAVLPHKPLDPEGLVVALALTVAVAGAYRFPIHVQVSSKVYVSSIALFLLAALLPPSVAGVAAAFGVLAGELDLRSHTHNPLPAIVTQSSRIALSTALASLLVHTLPSASQIPWPLIVAAGLMWTFDMLSLPLLVCPPSGEKPIRVIRMAIRS